MTAVEVQTIEVRGFLDLSKVFTDRGWKMPLTVTVKGEMEARQLLSELEIPNEQVEAVFINGKAYSITEASIKPGDRVALVPPGTPGPYRVWLGFVSLQ